MSIGNRQKAGFERTFQHRLSRRLGGDRANIRSSGLFYWADGSPPVLTAPLARARISRSSSAGTGQISTTRGAMSGTDRIRNSRHPLALGWTTMSRPWTAVGGYCGAGGGVSQIRVVQIHVVGLAAAADPDSNDVRSRRLRRLSSLAAARQGSRTRGRAA